MPVSEPPSGGGARRLSSRGGLVGTVRSRTERGGHPAHRNHAACVSVSARANDGVTRAGGDALIARPCAMSMLAHDEIERLPTGPPSRRRQSPSSSLSRRSSAPWSTGTLGRPPGHGPPSIRLPTSNRNTLHALTVLKRSADVRGIVESPVHTGDLPSAPTAHRPAAGHSPDVCGHVRTCACKARLFSESAHRGS